MRVVLGLLLLACCGGLVSAVDIINADASNTFHIIGGTSGTGWNFTGTSYANPTLNVTLGTTYYFSIEFDTLSANHPFGLSTDKAVKTASELGLVNNGSCGGTAPAYTFNSNTAPFCVLSFTPNTTTSLFYHCTFHSLMVGEIVVYTPGTAGNGSTNGNETNPTPTPTSAPGTNATTAPPTTAAPANTLNPDASNTFHITAGNAGTGYIFTGATAVNPTLNVQYGKTYTISIDFPSSGHPFGLNTDAGVKNVVDIPGLSINSTCVGSAATGFYANTTCTLTFTPPANTPQPLYYHCTFHLPMTGQIVVSGLPSGNSTNPPTNPPTKTPGTGFALVPGFAALFAVVFGVFAQ